MNLEKKIRAFAPASVGNVTCGFDVLGMAVEAPGDEVEAAFNEEGILRIVAITGDKGVLPLDARKNTAGIAVQALLDKLDRKEGIDLWVHKNMPMGSGLGSSAASAVAAVVAVNALLGSPLSKHELMPFTLVAEGSVSGTAHGDNVIPSLLGGIVLLRSYEPLEIVELPIPASLFCTVVHPDLQIFTKEARGRIPTEIPMKTALKQMSCLSGFVAGLYRSDYELIGKSLQDYLAEPYRVDLIKGFDDAKKVALETGALNFGISGSGPSVYSFSNSLEKAENIAKVIKSAFKNHEIGSESYVSKVNQQGAYILED